MSYKKVKGQEAVRDSRTNAILFTSSTRYNQAKKRKKMLDVMAKQEAELARLKKENKSFYERLNKIEKLLENGE